MSAVWARYTRGGERGGRGGRGVTTQVVAVAATQVVEAATGAELSLYLRGLCSRSARPHLTLDDVGAEHHRPRNNRSRLGRRYHVHLPYSLPRAGLPVQLRVSWVCGVHSRSSHAYMVWCLTSEREPSLSCMWFS